MTTFPDTVAYMKQLASACNRYMPGTLEKFLRRLIDGQAVIYPQTVIGTVVGGSSATAVVLGFTPDHVEVINMTDYNKMFIWATPMTSDTAVILYPASTISQIASGGVTPVTTAGSQGFSLGFNIAIASKLLAYKATKNRPTI